jgi:hypothetical protein
LPFALSEWQAVDDGRSDGGPFAGEGSKAGFASLETLDDSSPVRFVGADEFSGDALSETDPIVPPGPEAVVSSPDVNAGLGPTIATPAFVRPARPAGGQAYAWHLVPGDVLFQSFVAGTHQPRMAAEMVNDHRQGVLLDVALGSRVSIVRYGTVGPDAEGWELQVYGAALTRLSMERQSDVEATDYVFGVPIVYRKGGTAVRFGYDHVSSHIGDEFMLKNPDWQRINYVRDALAFAVVREVLPAVQVYGESSWAFHPDGGAGRWHFQFGSEYQPYVPPGWHGAPVVAVNTLLRQEFDFRGNFTAVAGWQWRGEQIDNLLRLGLIYYTGKSRQFSFYDKNETLTGAGIWYDF